MGRIPSAVLCDLCELSGAPPLDFHARQGMIVSMKIYTKTGDDGTTGLFGGTRVPKNHPRLECYGAVDELNAAIGLAAAASPKELAQRLQAVQNELLIVGSHLATPNPQSARAIPPLPEASVERLEQEIDQAEAQLAPLRQFILPGGGEAAARLHVCRTVCRRAERLMVSLAQSEPIEAVIMHYVNRLSDWLFVQARWANKQQGVEDVVWKK